MRETLKKMRTVLVPVYGKGEAEAIILLVFYALMGWDRVAMILHEDKVLPDSVKARIDKVLERLLNNEPVQYVLGFAEFHGLKLKVNSDVLIPRPETAQLVDIVVDDAADRQDLRVLDVGTGSGCIALALARSLRFAHVSAIDISSSAIAVAKENAEMLKVKVDFIHADMLDYHPKVDSLDIVVSNPPYILPNEADAMKRNVLDYEPYTALFVPQDHPAIFYEAVSRIGAEGLVSGGRIYLEINPLLDADITAVLRNDGYQDIETLKDMYNVKRFIKARRP